ncbi:MAG TPA: formylglycine-generating enzyme family protein [Verrucomicrobiae bacterium]|nr:formylglycine-generating enzyme family protein [Verrucomicrobiae bacterium]
MMSETLHISERLSPIWRDVDGRPQMVGLPAGEFMMGENAGDKFANDTERPAHRVCIPPGLALACFPVTVGEYRRFCPDHAPGEADDLPVVRINWCDATAFCAWLTEQTGHGYRLPSEAEWEYACRAGSRAPFAVGDEISPVQANFLYDENGIRIGLGVRTPVGHYPPNAFGLYDFHGNVGEWVADTWHPNYLGGPEDGRAWVGTGDHRRVVRGGAWDYLPRLLRSAGRDWRPADQRADNIGFRVATRDPEIVNHQ